MARHRFRRRRFQDRYVGLTIALPLCLLGFILLALIKAQAKPLDPLQMQVLIDLMQPEEEPPPPPPPTPPVQEPPPEPDTVATREDSTEEGEEIVDPQEGEDQGEEVMEEEGPSDAPVSDADLGNTESEPVNFQDWVPNTTEAAELSTIRREVASHGKALDAKRQVLKERLIRAEVSSAARSFQFNTDGGVMGAIRLLNIEGFPRERVLPVLERYGITYERKKTTPQAGRSYLNAAVTSSGTYTASNKEGVYEVMVLSGKAVHYMATREIDALQARGFDPRTSRIRKVVFGIVKNKQDELDLDVIDIDVEQIR